MRRWRIWLVLTLAALAAAVSTVGAAAAGGPEAGRPPIAAGEEQVIIPEGERLEDDLVVNAEKGAAVYGTLAGDLILLGADAVITGTVEGDVIGYANRVWISGQVLGNVRVLALEAVTIEGRVGRSAITVSQRATLGPEAEIGTTWFALSGDVELGGTVGRSLFATASRVTVSGEVGGDLSLHGYDQARVLPGAVVRGGILAVADRPPVVDDGASVGEVRFVAREGATQPPLTMDGFALGRLAGFAAVGLLVTWLAPGLLGSFQRRVSGHFWATLAVGAGLLAGAPVLALVLMLTVGGIPAALMVVLPLYAAAIYLGQVFVAGWLGWAILGRVRGDGQAPRSAAFLLGLVCLTLFTRLPYVRYVGSFLAVSLALGGLSLTLGPWIRRIARED
ncbi:hypothetical protein [Symbiobacterium thermophilum]|uniref:hypothetical protein n=1 Tax=Symbiobacterium thermophilum TaxID=2734 RepID=UPI0035C6CAB2